MINLLPTILKNQLGAARTNVILSRYIGITVLALVFMIGSLLLSYTILASTLTNAKDTIKANDTEVGPYSSTQKQIDSLSKTLSSSSDVLKNDIQFSKLLIKLGQSLPAGAIMGELNINQQQLQNAPLNLTVYTKNPNIAASLKNNLKSSNLFQTVVINSTVASGGVSGYPVVISLTATLNQVELY